MPNYRPLDEPVSGYKLLELLGEGAFGAVWKAEAPGGVPVAIKITAKLNGIHAIREWQSLQAVKHLTHPNLVNIHGVWLRDENGHVLSTEEVRAMIPAEAPTQDPPMPSAAPPSARRSSGQQRQPKVDPMSSTLRCETLVVGESASSVPPLDSPRSETSAASSGTDSASGVSDAGSNDSAATGSAGAGSAGSRERWARLGDSVPPLELITAMTLGDGTLLDRLRRCQAMGHKGIPRPELLSHLRDAVKGLKYLNDADIQHCDIKPENLLVVGGSVQVCDYGSALRSIYAAEARKVHGDQPYSAAYAAPTARALTNQGYTVQYAAPEQLGAKRIKLHKTTDLYALATTYYALRTGKFPWSDDADEPIEKLKYDEHFDFGALGKLNRHPYEADVLRRALRRDPKQRPQSVSDFFDELERAVGQEALAEAAARSRRRQIAGWSAVAVVLLMLVSAGFYFQDDLSKSFSQRTARDEFNGLLDDHDLDAALALVAKNDELTANEDETKTTWNRLTRELDQQKAAGDLALVQRAAMFPDKLKTPAYDDYLLDVLTSDSSEIGKELVASRPAVAAQRAKPLFDILPARVNESLQRKIHAAWIALPGSKDPADAAEQLVQMAAALPAVREHVRPELLKTIEQGVAAAEGELNRPAADLSLVPKQCERLGQAAAAYVSGAANPSNSVLAGLSQKAQVLRLAALAKDPAQRAVAGSEAAALAKQLAATHPFDNPEIVQLDLIAMHAASPLALESQPIARLAELGPHLKVESGRQTWDARLYRDLVRETLEHAASSLDEPGQELSDELLAALRTLPSEGSIDLRLAKALVARAAAGGKESPAFQRAGNWLKDTSEQPTQLDQRGHAALVSWHTLVGDPELDAARIDATLSALRNWRAGADQVPLADEVAAEVAEQLRRDLTARADRLAAGDAAAFVAATARVQEKLDEIAQLDKPGANAVQASLWQMSADLHAQRARIIALHSTTPAELAAAEPELKLLAQAEQTLAAAGIQVRSQDVELAALAVECYLTARSPMGGAVAPPPEVAAAWKAVQTALHVPLGAPAAWDRDYVSYVEQLALAAKMVRDPALPAADPSLAVKPDTKSLWFGTPLRRQAMATTLLDQALAQLPPLPAGLKFQDESSGHRFELAAATLEQARLWDDKAAAVAGLLAVCRMYERAAPENWQTIGELTNVATADSKLLAQLDSREPKYLRMHVWLAHARAIRAASGDNAERKLAAADAYAAALHAGEFDPYGERGLFVTRESALACYDEIVAPARTLLPADAAALGNNSRVAAIALVYGAQGALLEGRFFGPIAKRHFNYPSDLLAYQRAARDAFATAAALEADLPLGLRWRAGEARAADLLMMSGDEEQQNFERLTAVSAAALARSEWSETFESHNLQALLHHYASRRASDPVEQMASLLAADRELDLALTAHENHKRKGSPWCDSWLAQTHEEHSRVSLEQAWLTPWGRRRLDLLIDSVQHADLAQNVPDEHRLAPASCHFCAGNAYEDFALYMWFDGYFQPAEAAFEQAARVSLADPLWQFKADVYLGRLWVKKCMEDGVTYRNKAVRDRLRDQAIERLANAAKELRSPQISVPWLAREADFYVAEANRELFFEETSAGKKFDVQRQRTAEDMFSSLADEPDVSPAQRMRYLIEAAYSARQLSDAERTSRVLKYVEQTEALLKSHNVTTRRVDVVKLRFWLLDPTGNKAELFDDKAKVADAHLGELASASGVPAIEAQKKIMLLLARTGCRAEGFDAREKMLDRCQQLLGTAPLDAGVRQEYQIEVLTARQILSWQRAALASDPKEKEKQIKGSIELAEEVVQKAKDLVAKHQITLHLSPQDKPPNSRDETQNRFDARQLTLESRAQSVYTAAAAARTANQVLQNDINRRVKALWQEVDLEGIASEDGGPNDEQQKMFTKYIAAE